VLCAIEREIISLLEDDPNILNPDEEVTIESMFLRFSGFNFTIKTYKCLEAFIISAMPSITLTVKYPTTDRIQKKTSNSLNQLLPTTETPWYVFSFYKQIDV